MSEIRELPRASIVESLMDEEDDNQVISVAQKLIGLVQQDGEAFAKIGL